MKNKKFLLKNKIIFNSSFVFSSVMLVVFGFLALLPPASEPEVLAIIDGEQFALTISNNDKLNIDIEPKRTGTLAVTKDTVIANTNSPAGYSLYVSTMSDTNDIYLNGDESNDEIGKKIIATTGTFDEPEALDPNGSSWGFAVANLGNFDSSYNIENPSASAKFAAVPVKDQEQLIHDHTGRAINDETEIYYATRANTKISSGIYETTILYTTLSEATDQDMAEINTDGVIAAENYTNKMMTVDTSIVVSKKPIIAVRIGDKEVNEVVVLNKNPLSISFEIPEGLTVGEYDMTLELKNLAKSYTEQGAVKIYPRMQDMTPELCNGIEREKTIQLIDARDEKVYEVSKFADGKCWMTQNLDYNLSSDTTLTPEDSDVMADWTPLRSTVQNINSWANDRNTPYSYDPNNGNIDGNYYNWPAAIASNDVSSITTPGIDAKFSICPKGWRLPYGVESVQGSDFATLMQSYGLGTNPGAAIFNPPFSFTRSGYIISGTLDSYSNNGDYWTSTSNSAINAGGLLSSQLLTHQRGYGLSVRCVAHSAIKTIEIRDIDESAIADYEFETSFKLPQTTEKPGYVFLGYNENKNATAAQYVPGDVVTEQKVLYRIFREKTINEITTMQEMTSSTCAQMSVGSEKRLTDTRDGKMYYIQKLSTGNCWMLQNLDLNLNTGITLTNQDTDLNTVETWTPARSTVGSTGSWVNDNNAPSSYDPGNYYWGGYTGVYDDWTNGGTCGTGGVGKCDDVNTSGDAHYHLGNYYNYAAATATNNASETTSGVAQNSICPRGWRLPTEAEEKTYFSNGSIGEFDYTTNVNNAIVGNVVGTFSSRKLPRTGEVHNNAGITWIQADVKQWTSTIRNSSTAAISYIRYLREIRGSDAAYAASIRIAEGNKYIGIPMRCILK